MKKPPCKKDGIECPRRYFGCRSECPEYSDYLKIKSEEKAKILSNKHADLDVISFTIDSNKRYRVAQAEKYNNKKRNDG